MIASGARERSTLGSHVPEGALIVAGQGVGEPTAALDCLFESVPSARLLIGMPMTDVLDRAPAHLELLSFLAMGPNGRLVQEGRMQLLPMHLGDLGSAFATPTLRPDVVVVLASAPDAEGNCWLGIESDYLWSALQHDPVVLAELNEHVPVVAGDTCIPRDRIAAAVSSSRPLPEVPAAVPSALDLAIAGRILPFVEDGTCLQLGIGRQAEAVLQGLGDRRDLGFHSGMIGLTSSIEGSSTPGQKMSNSRWFRMKSVGTAVGAMQLALIRCGARSCAMDRMSPMTPLFAEVYAARRGGDFVAAAELVMITEPPRPASIIAGTAAETVCQTPVRLTEMTSSHCSWLISQNGNESIPIPALAMTMSISPKEARPASTTWATARRSRASAWSATIFPPAASTS